MNLKGWIKHPNKNNQKEVNRQENKPWDIEKDNKI